MSIKCEKCGFTGELIYENFGKDKLIICPDCYSFKVECCDHKKSILRKYAVNGSFRVQNMCSSCFTLFGQFIKQSDLNMNEVKLLDKQIYDKWFNEQSEKYSRRYSQLIQISQEKQKQEWFDKHNKYLSSMEWREKRDEVLKRDGYLCQACLKRRATQVHHISYRHWQNEPLYELISVCEECHEAITEIDRNTINDSLLKR